MPNDVKKHALNTFGMFWLIMITMPTCQSSANRFALWIERHNSRIDAITAHTTQNTVKTGFVPKKESNAFPIK